MSFSTTTSGPSPSPPPEVSPPVPVSPAPTTDPGDRFGPPNASTDALSDIANEPILTNMASGAGQLLSTAMADGLSNPYGAAQGGWENGTPLANPYTNLADRGANLQSFVGRNVDAFTNASDGSNPNGYTGSDNVTPTTGVGNSDLVRATNSPPATIKEDYVELGYSGTFYINGTRFDEYVNGLSTEYVKSPDQSSPSTDTPVAPTTRSDPAIRPPSVSAAPISSTPSGADAPAARSAGTPSPDSSRGRTLAPPLPVSPMDFTLHIGPGVVWRQYQGAVQEVADPNNPWWVRGGLGVLATLASPLAFAEEYLARPLANSGFVVQNSGRHIGEYGARAAMNFDRGETAEGVIDVLNAVGSFAEGFTAAAQLAAPATSTFERGALSPASNAGRSTLSAEAQSARTAAGREAAETRALGSKLPASLPPAPQAAAGDLTALGTELQSHLPGTPGTIAGAPPLAPQLQTHLPADSVSTQSAVLFKARDEAVPVARKIVEQEIRTGWTQPNKKEARFGTVLDAVAKSNIRQAITDGLLPDTLVTSPTMTINRGYRRSWASAPDVWDTATGRAWDFMATKEAAFYQHEALYLGTKATGRLDQNGTIIREIFPIFHPGP